MLKIAICDDDMDVCDIILKQVKKILSKFETKFEIDVYSMGKKFKDNILGEKINYYDLIFLDIQLDKENGYDIGKKIREKESRYKNEIIYVSSNPDYVHELYHISPWDFLQKPLDLDKMSQAIIRYMKYHNQESEVFNYFTGKGTGKVLVSKILYFENDKRQVKMFVEGECEPVVFYQKLDMVEESLSNIRFLRIHKSYLVSYRHISKIYRDKLILNNGEEISISKYRLAYLKERLEKIGFEG